MGNPYINFQTFLPKNLKKNLTTTNVHKYLKKNQNIENYILQMIVKYLMEI